MKSLRLAISACTVLMAESSMNPVIAADVAITADSARLAIIPAPREMSVTGGECAAKCKPKFEQVASIPPEGYELSVKKDGVTIRSSDAAGAFYAKMTLAQLKSPGKTTLPCVEIKDAPQYKWRGLLVDDCRHFFGKEKIKRVIDVMSQHKMNRLHWHLTDDQGWRLDIPGYPELARHASVRAASAKHGTRPHVNMKDYSHLLNGEKYGPFFYTEADIKEILAYAAERHVVIIPEIELPGHVYAALSAYPELACFPERLKGKGPLCAWGIEKDVLCIGNDKAVKFMEDVLDYVCKLFPGDVVHIGGDECPQDRWKTCPKCQARMKKEGIADVHGPSSSSSRRADGVPSAGTSTFSATSRRARLA